MTHRIQFVHARPRASHASLSHNPYPPKHSGDKPTQELSPVLPLWWSSNFLDPVEKLVGGPPTFTLIHWTLLRRSHHDDPQSTRNLSESPLECHLRRPCSPSRRFSSRLSLGNRSFPTLPLEELHTHSRGYEPEVNGSQKDSRPSSSASTFRFPNVNRWLPTPIRLVNATYPYHTYASPVL